VVTSVKAGQSAEAAGVRVGDVLLALAGRPTHSKLAFLQALRGVRPGDTLTLAAQRDGQQVELQLVVGGRGQDMQHIRALRKAARLSI